MTNEHSNTRADIDIQRPLSEVYHLLLISGVNVSSTPENSPSKNPLPDYIFLQRDLGPDIIDITTVKSTKDPLLQIILKIFGDAWAIAINAFFVADQYHAIIATGEDVGLKLAFLLKIFRKFVPLLLTCHNVATRKPAFFLKRLKVASAVSKFQCLSQSQAHILTEEYNIPKERVQIIYWHVDHNFFQPLGSKVIPQQICSAGMACRDYATLVESTRNLDVDVRIAADSAWFRQDVNISKENLPERVIIRSYENYMALRQLYDESLFVVVPLLNVNFSAGYTVILEAMSMGKPVIVSEIQQKDDFIINGENGFYVKPGDVEELRNRMQYLLDNPEEVERMGRCARKRVIENFTYTHYLHFMRIAITEAITK